jgi:hypothetical protein
MTSQAVCKSSSSPKLSLESIPPPFFFFFPEDFVLQTDHIHAAYVAQQHKNLRRDCDHQKISSKRMFSDPHAGRLFLSFLLAASVLLSAGAIPIPSAHTRHGHGARYFPRGDFAPSEPIDCKVVHRVLQQAPRASS